MSSQYGNIFEDRKRLYVPIFEPLRNILKLQTGIELPEGKVWIYYRQGDYHIVGFKRTTRQCDGYKERYIQKTLYQLFIEDNRFKLIQHEKYKSVKEEELMTFKKFSTVAWRPVFKKEERAIRNIQTALYKNPNHEPIICNSGGKRSVVLSELAERAYNGMRNCFWETTVTSSSMKKLAVNNEYEIFRPKKSMQDLQEDGFMLTGYDFGVQSCCSTIGWMHGIERGLINQRYQRNRLLFHGSEDLMNYINLATGWKQEAIMTRWSSLDCWIYIFHRDLPVADCYNFGYFKSNECSVCPRSHSINKVLNNYFFPIKKEVNQFFNNLRPLYISGRMWNHYNLTVDEFIEYGYDANYNFRKANEPYRQEVIDEHLSFYPKDDPEYWFNVTYCEKCGKRVNNDALMVRELFNDDYVYCHSCIRNKYNLNNYEWEFYKKKARGILG